MVGVGLAAAICGWSHVVVRTSDVNWANTWTRIWGRSLWRVCSSRRWLPWGTDSGSDTSRNGAIEAIAGVGWVHTKAKAENSDQAQTGRAHQLAPTAPILLLAGVQLVFMLISMVVVAALGLWGFAFWHAPKGWRPALSAAYGAALLQITLWMLIIPPLVMLTIASVVSDAARRDEVNSGYFGRVRGGIRSVSGPSRCSSAPSLWPSGCTALSG